jgi:hypothetical protein
MAAQDESATWMGSMAGLALFESMVARWALRARDGWSAGVRGFAMHWLLAVVFSLACLGWAALRLSEIALFLIPLIFVFQLAGAWQSLGAMVAVRYRNARSEAAVDRLLVVVGATAIAEATVMALLRLAMDRGDDVTLGPLWPEILFGLLAASLIAWAIARAFARRLWLAKVDRGVVPGWRVVDAEPDRAPQSLPVVRLPRRNGHVRVLVAVDSTHEPFRDVEMREPVALVVP